LKYLLFLFLAVWAGESSAQTCALTLSGHAEDLDTREKLAAATVKLQETGQQVLTDQNGDFRFTNLCPGTYTLEITHVSCDLQTKRIVLSRDQHLDLLLPHARKTLGEIVVESQQPKPAGRQQITARDLEETRGKTLAEALSRINGVTLLQTGSTISKPVIHGLHSSRLLTINNGVRQEGQQWGNEHAPEIDPFIAGKLSVVKGVDELRYGSDAIGGVILVEPRPLRDQPGYAAEVNTGYFTNNRQYVVSGVWEQQLKKVPAFRYRLQGTFRQGGNINTPDYRLNNTASREANFSVTAGWKKEKFNTEVFYSQFNTKIGIFPGSHIGNLTDLLNAINAEKPDPVFLGQQTYSINRPYQQVSHQLAKIKSGFSLGEHKFTVSVAGQFNHRQEYDIVRSSSNTRPQLDLSIATFTEDLSWEHPRIGNFTGVAGVSFMQQDNSYSGRYFIPNYFSNTIGAYALEKWRKHKWELQAGVRYDAKNIDTRRLKFNGDTLDYNFSFSTLAASVQAQYRPSAPWSIQTGISLSTRAPYVNELLSDGIHHGTATYEKGNIFLKPERSLNSTAGVRYDAPSKKFSADWQVYANYIHDFIYQQPRPDEPVLTIAGAFPLIEYTQTNALLYGTDLALTAKILPRLEWEGKLSILYAKDRSRNDWLIWMPANRYTNELTYQFKDKGRWKDSYISASWQHVDRQRRVPDETNGKQDYKAPPAAYDLIALNASTTVKAGSVPLTFGIGVQNLLNTRYRDYLNSMRYFTDEQGRNIGFRLRVPINSSNKQ